MKNEQFVKRPYRVRENENTCVVIFISESLVAYLQT